VRRVVLESPYAGNVAANIAYARACLRDCLMRGEAPLASHLLYTQDGIFRDDIPVERTIGIKAGHAWISVGEMLVVYIDRGVSPGMKMAIGVAQHHSIPVEHRTLPAWLADGFAP
jgi:hypothetical protein